MSEPRWQGVSVGIPGDLTAAADLFNSIIEFLIRVANIAVATLEVVKSLLVGLIGPIRAIIEAIIAEIEAFLNDLRQLGVYATWDEPVFPFTNIVGGFTAYQTRMLGKLSNRADPTRPNFSSRSLAVGVFLYVNANPTGIYTIINLIQLILRLFGINRRNRSYPTPVGLSVTYGTGVVTFGALGKILRAGETPDVAKVKWTVAAPATVVGPLPLIPAPPKFLLEVSVVPDGFGIAYNLPTPNSNENRQTFGVVLDPEGAPLRLYGGQTLALADSLQSTVSGDQLTIPGVNADGVKPNNVTVYAYRSAADNFPVPLSAITGPVGGKYLFQRTFVYDLRSFLGINLMAPGQPFTFRLEADKMPYNATITQGSDGRIKVVPDDAPAREVYVRVRAVGDSYVGDGTGTLNVPLYSLDESTFNGKGTVIAPSADVAPGTGFGPVSQPIKVTFPEAGTAEYLETVTTAILLLILSRSDLRPLVSNESDVSRAIGFGEDVAVALTRGSVREGDVGAKVLAAVRSPVKEVGLCPTGLEALARNIVPLFGLSGSTGKPDPKSLFGKEGSDQLAFRRGLLSRARSLAETFLERSGPPSAADLELVESLSEVSGTVIAENGTSSTVRTTPLRQLTWGQVFPEVARYTLGSKTIIQAFSDNVETYETAGLVSGVAPNPLSIERSSGGALRGMYAGSWASVSTGGGSATVDVRPQFNRAVLMRRAPGFVLPAGSGAAVSANIGQGSADMSPVVYAGSSPLWKYAISSVPPVAGPAVVFVRNGIIRLPGLPLAISQVLSYASGSYLSGQPTGAWVAIRLFPQGIPPVEEFLQKIADFLQAVLDGLQGIIDIIIAYIEFIQARILEFEALLRRIQALINLILQLDIGAGFSALVVFDRSGGGTDGLVRGLLGAADKPVSSQDDLGLGFALVAGGLPAAVLDLITLFFPSED